MALFALQTHSERSPAAQHGRNKGGKLWLRWNCSNKGDTFASVHICECTDMDLPTVERGEWYFGEKEWGANQLPCLVSELKVAVSLPMLCYDTAFNVSAVFMRFCDTCVRMCVCVCTCGSARAWEFTNSTPRCLVGEVNTAEKMTESTRCLWNGARHGRRHKTHTRATKTLTPRKKRQEAKKRQTSQSSKQTESPHRRTNTHARAQAEMMDCKAPVSIYLYLPHSALLLGFDTAREVRLNDMLGGRERDTGKGGKGEGRDRGAAEREERKKERREEERKRARDRWEVAGEKR